jgi:hypothetical protein
VSHFIRCDRCAIQDNVLGTVSLPPGWMKVLGADLCEPCCQVVRDFIRFKISDAARLPVEPIEEPAATGPADDKLFEIAPEPAPQVSADSRMVSEHASNGKLVPDDATTGESVGKTQPASAESSTEEVNRENRRKRRSKLAGQDAILPDPRPKPDDDARPGELGVH